MALRKGETGPKKPVAQFRAGLKAPGVDAGVPKKERKKKPVGPGSVKVTRWLLTDAPASDSPDRKTAKVSVRQWTYNDVRKGVAARMVRDLERGRFIERDDIRMIIADRTLDRRIGAGKALKPEEADGIARLLRVVAHARGVFDDHKAADIWLRSPNPELGGEVPMRMAATDVGAREVETVLIRIEHGVFS